MTNRNISFIVKDQNPLMLRPTDTVQTACQRMCERNVGAVLVTGGAPAAGAADAERRGCCL